MAINDFLNISNLEVLESLTQLSSINVMLDIAFQPIHNLIFSLMIAFVLFAIFIKAYILGNKENDTRLSITGAAFLIGGILEVLHVFESYYNDFITPSSATLLKAFLYLRWTPKTGQVIEI